MVKTVAKRVGEVEMEKASRKRNQTSQLLKVLLTSVPPSNPTLTVLRTGLKKLNTGPSNKVEDVIQATAHFGIASARPNSLHSGNRSDYEEAGEAPKAEGREKRSVEKLEDGTKRVLCIAEKPSVAKAIAEIMSGGRKRERHNEDGHARYRCVLPHPYPQSYPKPELY